METQQQQKQQMNAHQSEALNLYPIPKHCFAIFYWSFSRQRNRQDNLSEHLAVFLSPEVESLALDLQLKVM